jgi:hypothetical protein
MAYPNGFHDHPGIQIDPEIFVRDFIAAHREAKTAAAQILMREGWSIEKVAADLSIPKNNTATATTLALAINPRRNDLLNRNPQTSS